MKRNIPKLNEAVKFHGHLGPYLVLGLLAGPGALKKINCPKYFGVELKVYGATQRPKSCLIDGLQLSTGATFGKGNIKKFNGRKIKIFFVNKRTDKKICLKIREDINKSLEGLRDHQDAESFARKLYRISFSKVFEQSAYD